MNNARPTPPATRTAVVHLPTLAALALAATLAACGGGSGDDRGSGSQTVVRPAPVEPQPGGLSGRVLSAANGQPVAGATVEVGGATVTTGADGSFSFSGLTQADRVSVTISAAGFARTVRYTAVTNDIITTVPAQLLPTATAGSINAALGGTVSVPGSTALVTFPAGSIVTTAGAAPTQPVLVQVTPVSVAQDANLVTGDYRSTANGATGWLESFGALSIVLTDAAGGTYNLASGQSATIRIPASTRASSLPATVPLSWFDEAAGLWVQEGTASLTGTAPNQYYQAAVTHFTTWNADAALNPVQVTGCVRNSAGNRVARARVELDGVTYSGTTNALTDANGNFSVPMRRDATAAVVARSGSRLSNARAVTATTSNVSLGSDCLVLSDAALSMRLTWGQLPLDVDSHLLTPQGTHIDYTNKGSLSVAPFANLDIDDVTSFGPEIVSVRRIARGTYRYFLHNFSGTFNPGIAASPVKVEVTYNGNMSVFTPAAGEGSNEYWHAFDIVVDSQCAVSITPVNTWSIAEPTNPNQNGGAVTYCN